MHPGAATEPLDQLLQAAGAALRHRVRRVAAAHGLTATELAVLRVLAAQDVPTQRDLAAAAQVSPATLTPALDASERAGLLTRARDHADRRIVRVAITPAGRRRHALANASLGALGAGLPRPSPGHERIIRAYLGALLAAAAVTDTFPEG